jgi:nicotinic acid mononucleotide adenylyltransferase
MDHALFRDLSRPVCITSDSRIEHHYTWDAARPAALLPGSFNPVHAGHWSLADVAAEILGVPVAFELSVANVDKPDLDPAEAARRVRQFAGRAPVWVTRAPRFAQKAELFPGAVFVVGADTALRVVEPQYYRDDTELRQALGALRERACRFFVACRRDARGQWVGLDDVPVPGGFRDLFVGIPAERFRLDISSTEIRARDQRPVD